MFNNIRSRRKSFLLFTTMAVLLTALVGYLLMHRLQTDSMQSIQQSIDARRVLMTLPRWIAIAMVAIGWNVGVKCLAASGKLNANQAVRLARLRWRVVTWLVILEAVLGQGMFIKFISLMTGTIL